MRNAIGLGALIAVFSLSYSYGGPKSNEVKTDARALENKTCELVNGRTECAVKKGFNPVKD